MISKMSDAEYEKNEAAIMEAMREGSSYMTWLVRLDNMSCRDPLYGGIMPVDRVSIPFWEIRN